MWGILVNLLTRLLEARPRKDLIRETVQLRQAMVACQNCYREYKSNPSAGKSRWDESLATLERQLLELDQVLQIYDSNARLAIKDYVFFENTELKIENFEMFEQTLMTLVRQRLALNGFLSALEELDRFIRTNFKPEEVKEVLDKA